MPRQHAIWLTRPIRRRIAGWIAVVALLGHVLTAGPAMLRMEAGDPGSATVAQEGGDCHHHHPDGSPLCDHDHCLLCQGGVGLFILAGSSTFAVPPYQYTGFDLPADAFPVIVSSDAGYTSRAPPELV
jgi:hypothetical protein